MADEKHYHIHLWPEGEAALFIAGAIAAVAYFGCMAYMTTHQPAKPEIHQTK